MSCKSIYSNSVGSYRQNSFHEKLHATTSSEEKIKFAGEESKDRLYEPKQNKKMVRVVTVIVYVFSVSLAAIMLSMYYGFFWKASPYTPFNSSLKKMLSESAVTPNKTCCTTCTNSNDNQMNSIEEPTPIPVLQANIFTTPNSSFDYGENEKFELEIPDYEDTFTILNNNTIAEKEKRYVSTNITADNIVKIENFVLKRLKSIMYNSTNTNTT